MALGILGFQVLKLSLVISGTYRHAYASLFSREMQLQGNIPTTYGKTYGTLPSCWGPKISTESWGQARDSDGNSVLEILDSTISSDEK